MFIPGCTKFLENAISIVVALFPALSVYILLPGTTLAFFLLWLSIVPLFLMKYKEIKYNSDEFFFCFGIFLISLLSALMHLIFGREWFDFNLFYHNLYSIVICLVPLIIVTNVINIKLFSNVVQIFGIVSSLIIIWQWSSLLLTGSFCRELFIPWLDINRNIDTFSVFRPSAFFTEPAHFAIYMLPAFQIALLCKRKILSCLFGFAIFCSGSTTGFFLLFVMLLYHFYKGCLKKSFTVMRSIVFFTLGVIIFFIVYPDIFLQNFEKLSSASQGESSSNLRLFGPIAYLSEFNFFEHVLGLTLNQFHNFLLMKGAPVYGNGNYANAIVYMYISYGFTGLVLLGAFILKKWKKIKTSFGFFIVFLGIACSDQILFNGHYLYLLSFVLMSDKINCLQNSNEG